MTPLINLEDLLERDWWRRQRDTWRVEIRKAPTQSAEQLWLDVKVALIRHYSEPDGPKSLLEEKLWKDTLNLQAREFAVWDFDYYLFVVSFAFDDAIRAEKRVPGSGPL